MGSFLSSAKIHFISLSRLLPLRRHVRAPKLVIIIYHRVGSGTDSFMDVPLTVFKAQLDYLQENYDIVSLDGAVDAIQTMGLRNNMAVLTFDDGYYDFYTNALPVLQRRNLPAVLYLATYFIETGQRFPWDARFGASEWPSVRPLTWDELEELAKMDLVTIGSHTHTHPRLERIGRTELEQEIKTSIATLETSVGIRPTHFACPNGIYSQNLSSVAPHYFRTVSVGGWRPNVAGSIDFHYLLRIPAVPTPDLSLFAQSLTGAAWPLDTLAQIRYRFLRFAH
jgi:peptidoglycan/xylan/chitin deacetylase (PgdA/CDA1 family)